MKKQRKCYNKEISIMKKNTKHIENVKFKSGEKNYRLRKNSVLGFAYRIYKGEISLMDIYIIIMCFITLALVVYRIPTLFEMYFELK